jgi:hypothetical protein
VPTINIPPAAAAAAVAGFTATYDPGASGTYDPGYDPGAYDASDSFKPWDSRPIELGDDEDWLR